MSGCTGRCVVGMIVAIVFAALFVWTLVYGFGFQLAGNNVMSLLSYLVAFVFVAVAKAGKWYAMGCPHKHGKGKGMESWEEKPAKKRKR